MQKFLDGSIKQSLAEVVEMIDSGKSVKKIEKSVQQGVKMREAKFQKKLSKKKKDRFSSASESEDEKVKKKKSKKELEKDILMKRRKANNTSCLTNKTK